MPGTRHELAAAAPARVTTVRGWRDLSALEPALVALRDQDGECRITSVRPYTDDVWEVAAVSAGARHTVLAGLVRYAARLSCPWRLTLTGLRDGEEATWLAGQLPRGHVQPAPP